MAIGNNKLDENGTVKDYAEPEAQAEGLLNPGDLMERTVEEPQNLSDDDLEFC